MAMELWELLLYSGTRLRTGKDRMSVSLSVALAYAGSYARHLFIFKFIMTMLISFLVGIGHFYLNVVANIQSFYL